MTKKNQEPPFVLYIFCISFFNIFITIQKVIMLEKIKKKTVKCWKTSEYKWEKVRAEVAWKNLKQQHNWIFISCFLVGRGCCCCSYHSSTIVSLDKSVAQKKDGACNSYQTKKLLHLCMQFMITKSAWIFSIFFFFKFNFFYVVEKFFKNYFF